MEVLDNFYTMVQHWVSGILTLQGSLQFGAVLACAALALITHKKWQAYNTRVLANRQQQRMLRFLLKGAARVTFPLSMLLYIIVARFMLTQFDVNVVVLNILTPLLLSLAAIRISVFILKFGFKPTPIVRMWEGIISYGMWIIVALHLVGWLQDIITTMDSIGITMGASYFSVLSIFKLLFFFVIFMLAATWLSRFIDSRTKRSPHISASMQVGLTKISKFSLYGLAFLFALKSVGVDLSTFAVFSGAIGVGIGFGLQKIFSNFISGFILLFDRSIRPGDVITIGERFGSVLALHARYVVVRDRDGVETLIPNENLITSEVTNWSYTDKTVRVRIPVQISYNDDPAFVMTLLMQACEDQPRILTEPEAVARLTNFGDNGIDLELRVWLNDPENGMGNLRSDIYLTIWQLFKEHNVTIPFPQRDVHMVPNAVDG